MTYYVAGIPYSPNDIYHHGIKGQKWGLRRFQNDDGSLTEEGRRRYGTDSLGTNSNKSLRRFLTNDFGPLQNSKLRNKREDRLKNKVDQLKREGKDSTKTERKYEAQKQKNIDYEKYTANTSTKKLIAQSLLMSNYGARKYREARARGAGRVRAMASTAFFNTPIGFAATKLSEKKEYGEFVHSDSSFSQELYHWGIKGQKWGVRRFQNEDGTLTEEGKARYRNNPDAAKKYIKENWINSYNKTVDRINPKINEINKKYEGVDFNKDNDAYERYNKEMTSMMDEVANKVFDEDYGEILEISGLGRDWMDKHGWNDL